MLSFTAAVPRSVRDESPTLLLLRECQLMLHGDSYSHSSSSGSVTRCSTLRLLLRGECCSLRHLHTATSPLNSRAPLDVSIYISSCSSENVCSPESTQQPLLCMVWESPAPLSRSNPSLSAKSSRAVTSDRQQTASYRSSEELWQSTLVHVIRFTLEVVSAKVKESKYLASDSSHYTRRPEIVRLEMDTVCRCGRARLSRDCHLREPAPCLARQASLPKRP